MRVSYTEDEEFPGHYGTIGCWSGCREELLNTK